MTSGEAELAGRVIENPVSGERITIKRTAEQTGGALLAWELVLAPGGRVPASHSHPRQEERFTVLDGQMRFRIGWQRVIAGPGDTVIVPPGTVHHFANDGTEPARVAVETWPALAMEDLLEIAAAMARQQQAAGRTRPRPTDLARFMRAFESEVAAPLFPAVARVATRLMVWLTAHAPRAVPGQERGLPR